MHTHKSLDRKQKAVAALVAGLALIAFTFITLTPGCDRKHSGSAGQRGNETGQDPLVPVAVRLANAFVVGMDTPNVRIRAERFDPVAHILHNVRVDRRDAMIHADEAQIEIDEGANVARITLLKVVVVDLSAAGQNEGNLSYHDSIKLDPIPLSE